MYESTLFASVKMQNVRINHKQHTQQQKPSSSKGMQKNCKQLRSSLDLLTLHVWAHINVHKLLDDLLWPQSKCLHQGNPKEPVVKILCPAEALGLQCPNPCKPPDGWKWLEWHGYKQTLEQRLEQLIMSAI